MTTLDGAIAFVTGAGGGIGSAICAELTSAGATVVATDVSPGADRVLDVTDTDAVESTVADIYQRFGRLDIAVTAAGVGVAGAVEEISHDEWRRVIDVNLWGAVHVLESVYPRMVKQRNGHLVVMASLSGLVPTPLLTPYSMTKAGLVGLAGSLRLEAARHNIRTTLVCPGPVDTAMLDGAAGEVHGIDVRRYLTTAAGPALPPARLARAVLDGIRRDRSLLTPGSARFIHLGARLAPRLTERMVARTMHSAT